MLDIGPDPPYTQRPVYTHAQEATHTCIHILVNQIAAEFCFLHTPCWSSVDRSKWKLTRRPHSACAWTGTKSPGLVEAAFLCLLPWKIMPPLHGHSHQRLPFFCPATHQGDVGAVGSVECRQSIHSSWRKEGEGFYSENRCLNVHSETLLPLKKILPINSCWGLALGQVTYQAPKTCFHLPEAHRERVQK